MHFKSFLALINPSLEGDIMARKRTLKKYCPFRQDHLCLETKCPLYLKTYKRCGLGDVGWSVNVIASIAEDVWDVLNDIEKDLKQLVQILEKKQT
jgi:hypothetical protein